MKNPTRTNLNLVRKEAAVFLESQQSASDHDRLHRALEQYLTNGPTDEINKRSVNMIDRRLREEIGMTAGITSGQPSEAESHRGRHIGATVRLGDHTFQVDSYVLC
jgi:hypothetical protein